MVEVLREGCGVSEPVVIISELQEFSLRLNNASQDLYKLQVDFDEVAEKYDDCFNDLLTALLDDYEEAGKRLPGEDVRNALVTKKMREEDPILFGQYRRLRKELDRKERLTKSIEKQISARQSQLSYLKTEAQAA